MAIGQIVIDCDQRVGLATAERRLNLDYRRACTSSQRLLDAGQQVVNIVDPLPQALVLTAIVISLAVTALVVAIAIRIYDRYRTFDITKIRRLQG